MAKVQSWLAVATTDPARAGSSFASFVNKASVYRSASAPVLSGERRAASADHCGVDQKTVALGASLQRRRYDGRAIQPPTVADGTTQLRIALMAGGHEAAFADSFDAHHAPSVGPFALRKRPHAMAAVSLYGQPFGQFRHIVPIQMVAPIRRSHIEAVLRDFGGEFIVASDRAQID